VFPNEQAIMEYKQADMVFFPSKFKMSFDAYLPNLKLAFEYQGEQHYGRHGIQRFNAKGLAIRDEQRRQACARNGITLIEIPYWWDQQLSSLVATIHKRRPDLIPNPGEGIAISERLPMTNGTDFIVVVLTY
jgi:hypothetical protein